MKATANFSHHLLGAVPKGATVTGAQGLLDELAAQGLINESGVADATPRLDVDEPSDTLIVDGCDSTGSGTATFTATNAPAAISPKKWIKVTIGGVVGYLPWFST
ncbi:hypothetical protein GCM10028796_17080 [Ramlibacter monticola]|uniref:Uncharacterized protein n=1 Tax=Ramlibacter monticola TaxID=1926872 RepID=A0A936YYY4_9BURK|nr:hypothetical protein [Ramlibacter monticola]MBL0390535.1 hypothetical protein [Ramlibacter monticola]